MSYMAAVGMCLESTNDRTNLFFLNFNINNMYIRG